MKVVLVRFLRSRVVTLGAVLGYSLLLTACEDRNVRIYEVPTERVIAPVEPSNSDLSFAEPTSSNGLSWSVPESWEPLPVGTMRLASYRSAGGLEIAISKFPGDVGGDLANINRWRRQLSMPSVASLRDVEGLNTYVIPAGEGQLLRLRPSAEADAASVNIFWMSYNGETWFFKINGTADALDTSEPEMEAWLQSITKK